MLKSAKKTFFKFKTENLRFVSFWLVGSIFYDYLSLELIFKPSQIELEIRTGHPLSRPKVKFWIRWCLGFVESNTTRIFMDAHIWRHQLLIEPTCSQMCKSLVLNFYFTNFAPNCWIIYDQILHCQLYAMWQKWVLKLIGKRLPLDALKQCMKC